MGFGANLVFVYIFVPILVILILYGVLTGSRFLGKAIVLMIAGAICLSLLSLFIQWVTASKILKKRRLLWHISYQAQLISQRAIKLAVQHVYFEKD